MCRGTRASPATVPGYRTTSRSRPVCGRSFGTKCGFGQEAHVEQQVRVHRDAVLEPEAQDRDHQLRARRAAARDAGERVPQLVHGHRPTCRRRGRPCSRMRAHRLALFADAFDRRPVRRQRMRPPRLAEAPHQRRARRPRGRSAPGSGRASSSAAGRSPGTPSSILPSRTSTTTAARAISLPARSVSSASIGSSVDRQVVDAEVAEILERADRLRLARARQAGEDDEPRRHGRPARAPCGVPLLAHLQRPLRDSSSVVAARVGSPAPSCAVEPIDEAPRGVMAARCAAAGCAPRLRPGWRGCGRAPPACGPSACGRRAARGTRRRGRAGRTRGRVPSFELHDELDALRRPRRRDAEQVLDVDEPEAADLHVVARQLRAAADARTTAPGSAAPPHRRPPAGGRARPGRARTRSCRCRSPRSRARPGRGCRSARRARRRAPTGRCRAPPTGGSWRPASRRASAAAARARDRLRPISSPAARGRRSPGRTAAA